MVTGGADWGTAGGSSGGVGAGLSSQKYWNNGGLHCPSGSEHLILKSGLRSGLTLFVWTTRSLSFILIFTFSGPFHRYSRPLSVTYPGFLGPNNILLCVLEQCMHAWCMIVKKLLLAPVSMNQTSYCNSITMQGFWLMHWKCSSVLTSQFLNQLNILSIIFTDSIREYQPRRINALLW